jgi:hypothetical protein
MNMLMSFGKRRLVALCVLVALTMLGLNQVALSKKGQPPARQYSVMTFHSPNAPIEIRKVNNLQGEHFLRDLEVEVTNVSKKPIYFIRLFLIFPDVKMNGKTYGFSLYYGRHDLIDLRELADANDKPLQPSDSYIFKVPDPLWQGLDHHLSQINMPAAAVHAIKFRLDIISFGDGTGYESGGFFYASPKAKFIVPDTSKPASGYSLKKISLFAGGVPGVASWNDCPSHQSTCDHFKIETHQSFCVPINGPPVCYRSQAVVDRTQPCQKYIEFPFDCGGTPCEDDVLDLCDQDDGL